MMPPSLANGLSQSRVLVCAGTGGVGKTTTARIIAKGMNCVGPDGDDDGGADEGRSRQPRDHSRPHVVDAALLVQVQEDFARG